MKYLAFALFLLSNVLVAVGGADIITISDLNADSSPNFSSTPALELEGVLLGSPVNAGSSFAITSQPLAGQRSSALVATYLVEDVDLDGDGLFTEDFSFSITFASNDIGGVGFSGSGEVFGVGDDFTINPDESFSILVSVLGDTSSTHDVNVDGITEIDFESLQDAGFRVEDGNGSSNFISVIENNVLHRPFQNPVFEFVDGNRGRDGTVEDWSVQFSTVAVPEPSTMTFLGMALLFLAGSRRRASLSF